MFHRLICTPLLVTKNARKEHHQPHADGEHQWGRGQHALLHISQFVETTERLDVMGIGCRDNQEFHGVEPRINLGAIDLGGERRVAGVDRREHVINRQQIVLVQHFHFVDQGLVAGLGLRARARELLQQFTACRAMPLAHFLARLQPVLPLHLCFSRDGGTRAIQGVAQLRDCNHQSGIDPLLIQLCGYPIVHWLVAHEYYNMFGISFLFRQLKSIPVNRGGIDTAATKMAIRYAQEGGLVGLFPEGRVNTTEALLLPGRPVQP